MDLDHRIWFTGIYVGIIVLRVFFMFFIFYDKCLNITWLNLIFFIVLLVLYLEMTSLP